MRIRVLVGDDWPGAWPLLNGMGVPDGERECRERFLRLVENDDWFIVGADDADALVGYAAAQDYGDHLRAGRAGRVARLHDLYVYPNSRRRGVGRALMASVIEWAGMRVGFLQWQARQGDPATFYESLGYVGHPCPQPDHPEFEISFL